MNIWSILLIDLMCLSFGLGIWRLLKKNRLFLEFAVLWLSVAASISLVVSVPGLLPTLDRWKSVFFSSSLYVLASLLFILLFLVYITVSLSQLRRQVVQMAREVALLGTGEEKR